MMTTSQMETDASLIVQEFFQAGLALEVQAQGQILAFQYVGMGCLKEQKHVMTNQMMELAV